MTVKWTVGQGRRGTHYLSVGLIQGGQPGGMKGLGEGDEMEGRSEEEGGMKG